MVGQCPAAKTGHGPVAPAAYASPTHAAQLHGLVEYGVLRSNLQGDKVLQVIMQHNKQRGARLLWARDVRNLPAACLGCLRDKVVDGAQRRSLPAAPRTSRPPHRTLPTSLPSLAPYNGLTLTHAPADDRSASGTTLSTRLVSLQGHGRRRSIRRSQRRRGAHGRSSSAIEAAVCG